VLDLLDGLDVLDAMGKIALHTPTRRYAVKVRKYTNLLQAHHLLTAHPRVTTGNVLLHTLGTLPRDFKELDLVELSAGKLRELVGKTAVKELETHTGKLSVKLRRKGYVLALLPVPTEQIAETPETTEKEISVKEWDPYEAGRQAVEALKQAEGGAVDRNQAAKLLEIGKAQLYNRINGNKVVKWVDAAGRYQFPQWQFGTNGLIAGIQDCLQILAGVDEWAVMRFFLTPSEAAGNISPLNLLRAERIDEAKKIASAVGIHG
jgi:hypothetical protein